MPRYLCAADVNCQAATVTNRPVLNASTGLPVPAPVVFPQVFAGVRYETMQDLAAAYQASLPAGVQVTIGQDGGSFDVTHNPFVTPTSPEVWAQTSVLIVRSDNSANLCPLPGPVVGPAGGTYTTRAALITAVDNANPDAFYWETDGPTCPVVVAWRPGTSPPGNIVASAATTTTTMRLVEQSTGLQVACPAVLPIWLASDGSRHGTLASLAARVQTLLGAGYSVAVGADNCSLVATHSTFVAAPAATVQVFATKKTTVPVRLAGATVCPVPWPVRLASAPTGTQYSTLTALAAGWQATLPARHEVTASGSCQLEVAYPAVSAPPSGVDIVVQTATTGYFTAASSNPAGSAPVVTPTDTFGTFDSGKWDSTQGGPTISSGRLALPITAASWVERTALQDTRGREFVWEFIGATGAFRSGDQVNASIYTDSNAVQFGYFFGQIVMRELAGATVIWTGSGTAYNATAHRWLKMAVSASGVVTGWSSPDAVQWTQVGSGRALGWSADAVKVSFDANNSSGLTGISALIDNVNPTSGDQNLSAWLPGGDPASASRLLSPSQAWPASGGGSAYVSGLSASPGGSVLSSPVAQVSVRFAVSGSVQVALRNQLQFLTPTSRGTGVAYGYHPAVTQLAAGTTTVTWPTAGISPAQLNLVVLADSGEQVTISKVEYQ
jgi:hypothetical protein